MKVIFATIWTHTHFHMVAEHGHPSMSERIERLIVDAVIPLILEEIVEVVKSISRERIRQRALQEIADVLVTTIQEQMAADQEPPTQLTESHSSQSAEWAERQKSKAEELLAIHKTV